MHTQTRSVGQFLYNHNPFYLLSACLVLYGLQTAFQDGGSVPKNAWLLVSTLSGYTLLLAVTAYVVVRYGRVWEDARSLALLVIFMFVAISVSLDHVCNTLPSTAILALSVALGFALLLSECLIRGLGVKLPADYRFPLYLMFCLFFLYPLWVSPMVSNLSDESVASRVFCFPTLAGLILLTLIPAIRRGSQYLSKNGTPWQWPWYPWPIFVFLALGVCIRSYVLTFSFQTSAATPATDWRTSFGLYYLTPFFFAVLILLSEIAIAERKRGLSRFVMAIAPLLVLTAIPFGSGLAFTGFLDTFVQRLGSPIWLAVIGTAVFYGYLRERGTKSAEVGMLISLAAATFIGPNTLGLHSLTEPQAWPLALIGVVQLHKALTKTNSARCLIATASLIAAAACALRGTWFTDSYGAIPLHLGLLSAFVIASVFSDRFAVILRQVNALLTVVAAIGAVAIGSQSELPEWLVLLYVGAVTLLAAGYWQLTKREVWKAAMLANVAAVFLTATLWLHSGVSVAIPARAITALSWGAICFCVAALISAMKGGIGTKVKQASFSLIESVQEELREGGS